MSPCKLSEQNFEHFTIMCIFILRCFSYFSNHNVCILLTFCVIVIVIVNGSFFSKKTKLFTKFPGLATLGCYNSAVITDPGNSLPNGPSTGCLVSIFTVRINSNCFLCAVSSVYKKDTYPSDIRYCVLKPIARCSAGAA